MRLGSTALATSLILAHAVVSWTVTPLNPPSYPLAVRSPYLSAWLPQGAGTPSRVPVLYSLTDVGGRCCTQRRMADILGWPGETYNLLLATLGAISQGHQIVGWAGLATVNGKGYTFLGAPGIPGATFTKAIQKSSSVRSILS